MLAKSRTTAGFTLLEVLIAVLVLAIGLLGMASLVLQSMKSNQSSYQRTQASLLAYDMAERLRINSPIATSGNSYVITSTSAPGTNPGCASSSCTRAQTAQQDVYEWKKAVNDEGLNGTVSRNSNSYTISLNWNVGFNDGACAASTCAFTLEVNL